MLVYDPGFRRQSQPMRPEYWVGAEVAPGEVSFAETPGASLAYRRVADGHSKVAGLANRISTAADLQSTATILALHIAREFSVGDARLLLKAAHKEAAALGPLPISAATEASCSIVDRALNFDMEDIAIPCVLVDLLRLIDGVRP